MRSNEEFKAEVFTRRDNYLKQRRKTHKRILLCSIPLVICITVLSAFAINNNSLLNKLSVEMQTAQDENITEAELTQDNTKKQQAAIASVDIEYTENEMIEVYRYTDIEKISAVMSVIEADESTQKGNTEFRDAEDSALKIPVIITVTKNNGEITQYTIKLSKDELREILIETSTD